MTGESPYGELRRIVEDFENQSKRALTNLSILEGAIQSIPPENIEIEQDRSTVTIEVEQEKVTDALITLSTLPKELSGEGKDNRELSYDYQNNTYSIKRRFRISCL